MREKTITLKPYDHAVADDVFSVLFYGSDLETETGLRELPSASYQLVASALELIRWDVSGKDRDILKSACAIIEQQRDIQKMREFRRRRNEVSA